MQYRRTLAWMTLLMVIVLALAGCAPRIGAGETAKGAAADALVVDLPSIALDVAADGSLSFGGIALADLGGSLGLPPDLLALPADQVKTLTDAGVQHIQVNNTPEGLSVVINGQEIPSLGWTKEQLTSVGGLASGQPALAKLLPVLTQLGVGVTLRLPVPEGVAVAPLLVPATDSAAAGLAEGQQKFLTEIGSKPTITLPIMYNADGTWSLGGVSGDDWVALTGQSILKTLDQSPKQMAFVKAAGIRSIKAELNQDGIQLTLNDTQLPSIDWSGGKLATVLDLAKQSGLLQLPGLDPAMVQTLIDTFMPMLTTSDVTVVANYPAQ